MNEILCLAFKSPKDIKNEEKTLETADFFGTAKFSNNFSFQKKRITMILA